MPAHCQCRHGWCENPACLHDTNCDYCDCSKPEVE